MDHMGTTDDGQRKMRERRIGRRDSRHTEAVRDAASVAALLTAVVLLVSIAAEAHRAVQALAWIAFVGDLVLWRITTRRIRMSIEHVPVGLPSWRRDEGRPVALEL